MSDNKIFNVAEISGILKCSRESYKSAVSDPKFEYCLFVVETPDVSSLEVYYGSRKMKDFLVVNSLPSGREYPVNKIYLQINKSGVLLDLFYKNTQGHLVSLTSKILVKEVSQDSSFVKILWRDNHVSGLTVLSSDGVASQFVEDIRSQLGGSRLPTILWEAI